MVRSSCDSGTSRARRMPSLPASRSSWISSRKQAQECGSRHAARTRGAAFAIPLLDGAQKISFADFHAALAQQGIDHAGVEIEIRQHKIIDIAEGGEFPRTAGEFQFDGPRLIGGNLCRGN